MIKLYKLFPWCVVGIIPAISFAGQVAVVNPGAASGVAIVMAPVVAAAPTVAAPTVAAAYSGSAYSGCTYSGSAYGGCTYGGSAYGGCSAYGNHTDGGCNDSDNTHLNSTS